MKYFNLFFIITVFLLSVPAFAEYYRYVDKNGKVHYTDEYSNIPVDQRPKDIKRYRETPSANDYVTEPSEEQTPQPPLVNVQDPKKQKTRKEELSGLNERYNHLKQIKTELDNNYDALSKKREQLEKERKDLKTKKDIIQYNKKIEKLTKSTNAYDQKTKDYTDKQATYNIDIQAFNKKVQEELKQRINTYKSGEEASEQDDFSWDTEPQETKKIDKTASIDEQREILFKQKAKIEKEYEALSKEKEQIADEKKNLKTKADVDKYMQKKEALNKRINSFQKRQQAFDEEILMFNTRQEQESNKTPETTE